MRRLTGDKPRASIITANKSITVALIADYMFGRWVQEDFFRYMGQEYVSDNLIQYDMEK